MLRDSIGQLRAHLHQSGLSTGSLDVGSGRRQHGGHGAPSRQHADGTEIDDPMTQKGDVTQGRAADATVDVRV